VYAATPLAGILPSEPQHQHADAAHTARLSQARSMTKPLFLTPRWASYNSTVDHHAAVSITTLRKSPSASQPGPIPDTAPTRADVDFRQGWRERRTRRGGTPG
jgi:hypothetical protein